ncbi:MAG: hypothetical protein AAGJ52_04285, partial [Pseudomonadota bacterium]
MLLLTGCPSSQVKTNLGEPQYLEGERGVLSVQIVSNAVGLAPSIRQWKQISLVDVNDSEVRVGLARAPDGHSTSDLFLGSLPPGTYRLESLFSSEIIGGEVVRIEAPIPVELGEFDVVSGSITNLGTLLFHPTVESPAEISGGDYPFSFGRVEGRMEIKPYLESKFDWLPASYFSTPELSWNEGSRAALSTRDLSRMGAVPVDSVSMRDGTLVSIGKLGQLRWRGEGSESWSRSDTGAIEQIEHVGGSSSGLIAIGERGLVLRSDGWGESWSRVQGPGADQVGIWAELTDQGKAFLLTRSANDILLYGGSVEDGDWDLFARFELDYDLRSEGDLISRGRRVAFAHLDDAQLT